MIVLLHFKLKMKKIMDFSRDGINYSVFQFNGNGNLNDDFKLTVKDIGAYETIEFFVRQGFNVIVNVTSGNNGEALKRASLQYNQNRPLEERVKIVHICHGGQKIIGGLSGSFDGFEYSLPYNFSGLKDKYLLEEDRISIAEKILEAHKDKDFKIKGIADATHHIPDEYIRQAKEILQQTVDGKHLDYLVLPVGTGRTFLAFYSALEEIKRRDIKINTKLVGLVPRDENPIFHQFVFPRKNGTTIENIVENYYPISLADKLSCPATDLIPYLRAAMVEGHIFVEVDNDQIKKANIFSFKQGRKYSNETGMKNPLELENSGSVGFALLDPYITKKIGIKKSDNVGIFTTGRGLYSTPIWEAETLAFERAMQRIMSGLKNVSIGTLLFSTAFGGLFVIDYYAKSIEQEATKKYEVRVINEIMPYDSSMAHALDKIRKKHGIAADKSYLDFPPQIINEVILNYLELNEDKISKAKNPNDIVLYDTLKSLAQQRRVHVEK